MLYNIVYLNDSGANDKRSSIYIKKQLKSLSDFLYTQMN